MMKKIFISILFCTGIFYAESAFAQIPPGVLPMQYNPSFAGTVGNSRIVSNISYHYQNDSYSRKGYGLNLSYDNYLPKIRSGIGITANANGSTYGDDYYKTDQQSASISFIAAPKISLKGKYTISPSLQVSYIDLHTKYNSSHSYYEDKYLTGLVGTAGILFNATHYYIGYSIRIFNSYGLRYRYNDKIYSFLQFGYTFQKSADSKFSFTPQIVLPITGDSKYYLFWPAYTLGFRYDNYLLGVVSNYTLFIPTGIQLGWQNKRLRLIASIDFSPGYQANISMRYIFNHDKKSRNILNNLN
jgi:hypothetical protein